MESNPLIGLSGLGQSIWYDYIDRNLLRSGTLARMINEDGLKGVTSNPTIFEKAIEGSDIYDDALMVIARGNPSLSAREYFYTLAVQDIRAAADVLMPVYERSKRRDGMVSLEVSPDLAHDTDGSIAEARRLYALVDRPNVMIKIPATQAGIPAVEQLISEGINVNVTLLFSLDRYMDVARAYLRGLRKRMHSGGSLVGVASVASFFVSRVDSLIDQELQKRLEEAAPGARESVRALLGTIAISNAKLAYQKFLEIFAASEFVELQLAGAQTQRLLWASTGTKNPAYSDVMYIESLVGPETVNTVPPATYESFKRHGRASVSLGQGVAEAREHLEAVARLGINLPAALQKLEADGVAAFKHSFDSLLSTIEGKLRSMLTVT